MTVKFDFRGKTALVVGGSSGIGNAIAQRLRKSGAVVTVWGTRTTAKDYADSEGSDLEGLSYRNVNVGDLETLDNWQPDFEYLDVLVLSQGTVRYKREEFEFSSWTEVMNVNLDSLMLCANKCYAALRAAKGSLVIVSSTVGFRSARGNPAYTASKAGAIGLTRALAEAWAGDGIRVNGVAPGLVRTKLTTITTDNPDRLRTAINRIPAGRLGDPEEIANAALFLASPLASYVYGHTIVVDGGLILS